MFFVVDEEAKRSDTFLCVLCRYLLHLPQFSCTILQAERTKFQRFCCAPASLCLVSPNISICRDSHGGLLNTICIWPPDHGIQHRGKVSVLLLQTGGRAVVHGECTYFLDGIKCGEWSVATFKFHMAVCEPSNFSLRQPWTGRWYQIYYMTTCEPVRNKQHDLKNTCVRPCKAVIMWRYLLLLGRPSRRLNSVFRDAQWSSAVANFSSGSLFLGGRCDARFRQYRALLVSFLEKIELDKKKN